MAQRVEHLPLLRGLMSRSRDAMVIARYQTGTVVSVNQAMTQITGRATSDVTGQSLTDSGLWFDLSWLDSAWDELSMLGAFGPVDTDLHAVGGLTRRVELTGFLLRQGDDDLVVIMARPSFDRRGLELAAGAFATVLDQADEALALADGHGILTAWNRRAEALTGLDAETALGQPVASLLGPAAGQLLTEDERLPSETVELRPGGPRRRATITISGSPVHDLSGGRTGTLLKLVP